MHSNRLLNSTPCEKDPPDYWLHIVHLVIEKPSFSWVFTTLVCIFVQFSEWRSAHTAEARSVQKGLIDHAVCMYRKAFPLLSCLLSSNTVISTWCAFVLYSKKHIIAKRTLVFVCVCLLPIQAWCTDRGGPLQHLQIEFCPNVTVMKCCS